MEVFECDLNNKIKLNKVINKIKPMTIFHLAAYGAYSSQDNENLIKNLIKECLRMFYLVIIVMKKY